jgi:adenylate kinase family enzyme
MNASKLLKVNVVGTSGSGKSTFSRKLATKLQVPHIELDALFWLPNWGETPDEQFFEKIRQETATERWVLDGNYNRTVPVKWRDVDTVIWINYSYTRTVLQAVKRAFIRSLTRKELWAGTGNKESFRKSFMSKDSVIMWTLKTYHSNVERYESMMADPQYDHIQFIRLRSPRQSKAFLAKL